ncbi:MAG: site-2 protease family protein [Ignavibacteria bacterium]|nr:MAG: site-2 protease family protein [Ignavibacteria bacterium]
MDITVDPKLFRIIFFIPFLLISLAVHEFAHAYFAHKFGDNTAKDAGRLTLNPIKHLDLFGSIILPAISLVSGFAVIGWAKPVPVNRNNFGNPRRDDIIVSIAGPISNFVLANLILIVMVVLPGDSKIIDYLWLPMFFNVLLFYFNLLPIPPLDGSHILTGFLSNQAKQYYYNLAKYSIIILLLLIYSPLWRYFIELVQGTVNLLVLFYSP